MAEFGRRCRLDGLGGGEIGVGSAVIALLPLARHGRKARLHLRIDLQRRRENLDRVLEFAELEVIAEAAAGEGVGVIRLQP